MPEGIPYASTNVIAGVGKDLNYVGKHCYAYSGVISVDNNENTLLEFTTGNETIKCLVDFNYPINVSDDYLYQVYMNGLVVYAFVAGSGHTDLEGWPSTLIIPPYTKMKLTAKNIADTSANNQVVILTGRLYK